MATVLLGAGLVIALVFLFAIRRKLDDIPRLVAREVETRSLTNTAKHTRETIAVLTTAVEHVRALRELRESGVELLIEQRATTGELAALARMAAKQRAVPPALEQPPDDDQRKTVEMPRPSTAPDDGEEPEEELTTVASRPVAGTAGAPNGLRLRATIPPASPRGSVS